ncbi:MAG: DUF2851 family protein [Candidatus Sumerlaeaceae bacterium]|nr:DUF2851 family protein [Candidatus Sumerlaeaceae bacterium]
MSHTRYIALRDELQSHLLGDRVADGGGGRAARWPGRTTPDERIVQMIWAEQLMRGTELVTCTGKPLRVISPGQWNGEAGPDFRTAELEIGGRRLRGDVEIHVESADWERHQHHRDFEYNGVVLHAFLRRTDRVNFDGLHNGTQIERIELESFIHPDLETVSRTLSAEDCPFDGTSNLGRCHTAVSRLGSDFLRKFFDAAARERVEAKVARFAAQLEGETPDQVLYQAIMTAMGHKGGKTLFFLLAKRTPIEELKDYLRDVPPGDIPAAIEAVLLHVANLVPAGNAKPDSEMCVGAGFDGETQDYLNHIHRWWSELSGYFADRLIPPTRRWFSGIRPPNFPTRRLGGIARLLTDLDFRRGLVSNFARRVEQAMARNPKTSKDFKREIAQLATLFEAKGASYWKQHYTFGGKPAPRPMQLIGADRAESILFNALLPMLLLHARREKNQTMEDFIWRLVAHFPALPDNAITKFMRHRLFGPAGHDAFNFRLEKQNQALFHIFHDCCNNNARTCDDCVFFRVVEG